MSSLLDNSMPSRGEWCQEKITHNHETFMCDIREDEHSINDGEPIHFWEGGVWPPCPDCFGIDEHSQTCTTAAPHSAYSTIVTWVKGQKPKIRRGK